MSRAMFYALQLFTRAHIRWPSYFNHCSIIRNTFLVSLSTHYTDGTCSKDCDSAVVP